MVTYPHDTATRRFEFTVTSNGRTYRFSSIQPSPIEASAFEDPTADYNKLFTVAAISSHECDIARSLPCRDQPRDLRSAVAELRWSPRTTSQAQAAYARMLQTSCYSKSPISASRRIAHLRSAQVSRGRYVEYPLPEHPGCEAVLLRVWQGAKPMAIERSRYRYPIRVSLGVGTRGRGGAERAF